MNQFLRKGKYNCPANTNIRLEPLPLEYSQDKTPLLALYKKILQDAGVKFRFSLTPLACRLFYSDLYILGIGINETSNSQYYHLKIHKRDIRIPIPAGGSRLFLLDQTDGHIILISPGETPKTEIKNHP